MRRIARLGPLVWTIAVVAGTSAGCTASGSSADRPALTKAPTSIPAVTTTASTTTTTTAGPSDEEIAWEDVLEVANAQHGSIVRSVNMYDQDSGEPLVPEFDIELRFDGEQELADAVIEFPASEDSPEGGRIEYTFTPDHIYLRTEEITGGCGDAWVALDEMVASLDSGMAGDLGDVGSLPMPPFDLLVDHEPVEGSGPPEERVFPFEIPASMLVAASLQQRDPAHWEKLVAMDVPAEVLLTPSGLAIEATAPALDVMPPVQGEAIGPAAEQYEMYGRWELTPSDRPLGLSIPTDVVAFDDDCIEG